MPAPHTATVRKSCSSEHKQSLVRRPSHREVLPGRLWPMMRTTDTLWSQRAEETRPPATKRVCGEGVSQSQNAPAGSSDVQASRLPRRTDDGGIID